MASDITGGVQAMEAEAAKVMDEAKARASDIVLKSRESARKMASEQLPLDDVKAECVKILKDARQKADAETKQAEKQVGEIKTRTAGKTDEYGKSMARMVLGEKAR